MAMRATRKDAIQTKADDVEAHRATMVRWAQDKADTEAELARIRAAAGEQVLDDPASAATVATHLQALRDRLEIADRAVEAQRPRVVAAETAYITAEADALETALQAARDVLAVHEAKTTELLAALEQHEGRFVPEVDLIRAQRSTSGVTYSGSSTSWALPKSAALREPVRRLERQLAVLRELVAGRSPEPLVQSWQSENVSVNVDRAEVYPACVYGPDAFVPAAEYVARVEALTPAAGKQVVEALAGVGN